MLELTYLDDLKNTYFIEFERINDHVIELLGDIPIRQCGFYLSRENMDDKWDYKEYTTIYRRQEGAVAFSNDGSEYVAPIIEQATELTAEEIAEIEKQQKMEDIQMQISALKAELSNTDYQIIKTSEYQMVGKITEYNIEELHQTRQSLRERINSLESQLE